MRTFSSNTFRYEYPDTMVMAFDAVPINIAANDSSLSYRMTVTITNATTNQSLIDTRTAHNGNVSFDLAGYVQALMAPQMDEPFKPDAYGYLPMVCGFNIELLVTIQSVSDVVFRSFFTAMWGSLPVGKTFNGARSVKIWQGYPNITAIFGHVGTKINDVTSFDGTKLRLRPGTTEYLVPFSNGSTNPWSLVTRNSLHTAVTSVTRPVKLACVDYTSTPATFDASNNYLRLNISDSGYTEMRFAVTADNMRIKSWKATLRGTNNISYTIRTSNGNGYEVYGASDIETIEITGLSAREDTFTIQSSTPPTPDQYYLIFALLQVTIEDIGTGQLPEQTFNVTGNLQFLTYRRTGVMTLQGISRTVTVKTVMQCGTNGVFLRWIDSQGFPVSWLFQKGGEQRKVSASSAYRANMADGLYLNNGNAQQLQVDTKDAKVTQELAASLVTAEEYDTLLSILTSPVVELWDGNQWQRVNVSTGTNKRSKAVKQQFEFSIVMPEEVAQQL